VDARDRGEELKVVAQRLVDGHRFVRGQEHGTERGDDEEGPGARAGGVRPAEQRQREHRHAGEHREQHRIDHVQRPRSLLGDKERELVEEAQLGDLGVGVRQQHALVEDLVVLRDDVRQPDERQQRSTERHQNSGVAQPAGAPADPERRVALLPRNQSLRHLTPLAAASFSRGRTVGER
jgi:hypothetical protein